MANKQDASASSGLAWTVLAIGSLWLASALNTSQLRSTTDMAVLLPVMAGVTLGLLVLLVGGRHRILARFPTQATILAVLIDLGGSVFLDKAIGAQVTHLYFYRIFWITSAVIFATATGSIAVLIWRNVPVVTELLHADLVRADIEAQRGELVRTMQNSQLQEHRLRAAQAELAAKEAQLQLAQQLHISGQLSPPPVASDRRGTGDHRPPTLQVSKRVIELPGLESANKLIEAIFTSVEVEKKFASQMDRSAVGILLMGPPGVGKTTIARIVGERAYAAGVTAMNRTFEVNAQSLFTVNSITEPSAQIEKIFAENRGCTIFLDEAPSIADQGHSAGNLGTSVAALLLTEMQKSPKTVVIFAGYKADMKKLWGLNQGLESRFQHSLDLPPYSFADLQKIFQMRLNEAGMRLTPQAIAAAEDLLAAVVASPSDTWANARSVGYLVKQIRTSAALLHPEILQLDRDVIVFDVDSVEQAIVDVDADKWIRR